MTLADGVVIRGVGARSWRWRVVKLEAVEVHAGAAGWTQSAGATFIPWRSICYMLELESVGGE